MLNRLGITGALGALLVIGGIGLLGVENLRIAAGVALVLAGTGLLAHGVVTSALASFGLR